MIYLRILFTVAIILKIRNANEKVITTCYGEEITAMISKENIIGTQFHPEKSHYFWTCLSQNFFGTGIMHFYPAIDIKNGQFIRLKKGQLDKLTIYGDDPVKQAKKFCEAGAKWIHIVDIDGAFNGVSKNMDVILRIRNNVKSKIQVGGGIRQLKTIQKLLNHNIDRIVLGTVALTDPPFVKKVCEKFPGRIAIGLDTKNEFVATEGWAKESKINFENFLKLYENTQGF